MGGEWEEKVVGISVFMAVNLLSTINQLDPLLNSSHKTHSALQIHSLKSHWNANFLSGLSCSGGGGGWKACNRLHKSARCETRLGSPSQVLVTAGQMSFYLHVYDPSSRCMCSEYTASIPGENEQTTINNCLVITMLLRYYTQSREPPHKIVKRSISDVKSEVCYIVLPGEVF